MGSYSRHVADFNVAGMRFWDGALVLDELKPGNELDLVGEDDNPHDPNAVALCWEGTQIGYVPREENELVAQLLRFGHSDVLGCRILKVDASADIWKQVHVGLYLTDKRIKSEN